MVGLGQDNCRLVARHYEAMVAGPCELGFVQARGRLGQYNLHQHILGVSFEDICDQLVASEQAQWGGGALADAANTGGNGLDGIIWRVAPSLNVMCKPSTATASC